MKSIHTLIPDIYDLVESKDAARLPESLWRTLGSDIALRLKAQHEPRSGKPSLRLSQMGPRCPKALWHSIHTPELAEPLPPWAEIKYSYGHILEAYAIALARGAGHQVEGCQDELHLDGATGHRDCVIDGCVVDIKSASSRSFLKFKDKSIRQNDNFGYLEQLDGYILASADDDLVQVKDRGYLLAIDKQLGHMVIYEHILREDHIRSRIRSFKEIVSKASPPDCECRSIEDGKAGNLKLDTRAAYSSYKFCCNPHIRTFLYSDGPRYLTRVVRRPDVVEIDRFGNMVYN